MAKKSRNVMDIVDSAQSGKKPFHERAGMSREEVARGRARIAEEARIDRLRKAQSSGGR
jgi:hypothetical protein